MCNTCGCKSAETLEGGKSCSDCGRGIDKQTHMEFEGMCGDCYGAWNVCQNCGRDTDYYIQGKGFVLCEKCYGYKNAEGLSAEYLGNMEYMQGRILEEERRKNRDAKDAETFGAEGLYECSECKHWNRNPVAGITKCKKCGHGSFNQVKRAETFEADEYKGHTPTDQWTTYTMGVHADGRLSKKPYHAVRIGGEGFNLPITKGADARLIADAPKLLAKSRVLDKIVAWHERNQSQSESIQYELDRINWMLENPDKDYDEYPYTYGGGFGEGFDAETFGAEAFVSESEKEELERLRSIVANLPDSVCRCCGEGKWTTDGIDFTCAYCEEMKECEFCNPSKDEESEKEELERLRSIVANLPDSVCRCCGDSKWTTDGIDFTCAYCEEMKECEFCRGDEVNAETFGAERRYRYGNRYITRNSKGQIKKNVSVGRSLAADRRRKAKTVVKGVGQGGSGDYGAEDIVESLQSRTRRAGFSINGWVASALVIGASFVAGQRFEKR